jgi:hypothetical protein
MFKIAIFAALSTMLLATASQAQNINVRVTTLPAIQNIRVMPTLGRAATILPAVQKARAAKGLGQTSALPAVQKVGAAEMPGDTSLPAVQ